MMTLEMQLLSVTMMLLDSAFFVNRGMPRLKRNTMSRKRSSGKPISVPMANLWLWATVMQLSKGTMTILVT